MASSRPLARLDPALVSEIIHAHDGSLNIDGEEGVGATMTIRLTAA